MSSNSNCMSAPASKVARQFIDSVVRDATGEVWAQFLYPAMAQEVANRCNRDPALAHLAPFTWKGEPRHV